MLISHIDVCSCIAVLTVGQTVRTAVLVTHVKNVLAAKAVLILCLCTAQKISTAGGKIALALLSMLAAFSSLEMF